MNTTDIKAAKDKYANREARIRLTPKCNCRVDYIIREVA